MTVSTFKRRKDLFRLLKLLVYLQVRENVEVTLKPGYY